METINHECYVSLEVAKLLKEAGFDWEGTAYYQHGVLYKYSIDRELLVIMNQSSAPAYMEQYSSPTLEVAQRWLREVKNREVFVECISGEKKYKCYYTHSLVNMATSNFYSTYEESLEAGIKKALETILEKGE